MIYRCWNCGWRINQRYTSYTDKIGTHLLYDHVPFCSEYCIDLYKLLKTKPKESPKSDWYEDEWKLKRKINRKKEVKF